ncbi:MAG: ABC transporter substrate-binding protein [Gammaproteobacteria bacterium]
MKEEPVMPPATPHPSSPPGHLCRAGKTVKIAVARRILLAFSLFITAGLQYSLAAPQTYRFALVTDRQDDVMSGAEQGISEANLQGRFLDKQYTLSRYASADTGDISGRDYVAILAALPARKVLALAKAFPDHAVFNLTAKSNKLRTLCLPNLLHVIPSDKMYAGARRQWHEKHGKATILVSAWHPDFVKFAARDLNKRYKAAFNKPMDERAWAGWAAVKMTSDHLARDDDDNPAAVLTALKTGLAFDGQKGLSMYFRGNGQLRQILLVEDKSGELLGEAPVRGVAAPNDVDSLGVLSCARERQRDQRVRPPVPDGRTIPIPRR